MVSEILLGPDSVSDEERQRFVQIINEESQRLTRLLDRLAPKLPADPGK